ncbi:MAG TPA: hypothetical protein PL029_12355 [Bacteroidia bacterium]|nr:hypothetical protein [Bacteroidia bacterium]
MNETQQIENYLLKGLLPEDKLLFEAKLLLNKDLQEKLLWQQSTYELIKQHGRKQIKKEIEAVSLKLFSEKKYLTFRKKILQIFNKDL